MTHSTQLRLAVAAGLALLLLISPPAPSGGPGWDLAIGCGYGAGLLLLCLYVYPVRGDGLPHARLLALSQHRRLGWSLLALVGLHIGLLSWLEPLSLRWLLPSAPLYMGGGLLALACSALLIPTGLAARAALRRGAAPRLSTLHLALSALLVPALAAHILGSAQLISGGLKGLTPAAAVMRAWQRRRAAMGPRAAARGVIKAPANACRESAACSETARYAGPIGDG